MNWHWLIHDWGEWGEPFEEHGGGLTTDYHIETWTHMRERKCKQCPAIDREHMGVISTANPASMERAFGPRGY